MSVSLANDCAILSVISIRSTLRRNVLAAAPGSGGAAQPCTTHQQMRQMNRNLVSMEISFPFRVHPCRPRVSAATDLPTREAGVHPWLYSLKLHFVLVLPDDGAASDIRTGAGVPELDELIVQQVVVGCTGGKIENFARQYIIRARLVRRCSGLRLFVAVFALPLGFDELPLANEFQPMPRSAGVQLSSQAR